MWDWFGHLSNRNTLGCTLCKPLFLHTWAGVFSQLPMFSSYLEILIFYFIIALTVLRNWCENCTGTPTFSSMSFYIFPDYLHPSFIAVDIGVTYFWNYITFCVRLTKPFAHNLAELFNLGEKQQLQPKINGNVFLK